MTYATAKSMIVLLALLIAGGIFGMRLYQRLWVSLKRGRPSDVRGQWGERAKGLLVYVGGQRRLFRFLVPGSAHFFIFWGFVILSPTILGAIVEGLAAAFEPRFVLPLLGESGPLAFLQDFMALFVIVAVIWALYVRIVDNPRRYEGSHKTKGVMVLGFILVIMLSLLVINACRIRLGEDPLQEWRPVSTAVSTMLRGLTPAWLLFIEETSYWIHFAVVMIFLTELPTGKHFHVVTSLPAVFLRNLQSPGRLPPDLDDDGDLKEFTVENFPWRRMLDFYTCTECGRCQDVCPTFATDSALSPKHLIMNLRDNLVERNVAFQSGTANGATQKILAKSLVGDVITDAEIWACTTCFACDQECPLFIEHVTPIVDLRRQLVREGSLDNELQNALINLGRYGNSFGKSTRARAKWTRSINPKIKDAAKSEVEYLWFVGDYASYNSSLIEITQKTAEVFQMVGLDFGLLYGAESNSGNDVRRIGEEGLFEMLQEKNANALRQCTYEAIVTTDPHTYNALKNEYPADLNGTRPILHYSELLDQLIISGQLTFKKSLGRRVTYQDPCYLGRYNGVYDAPRRVIGATGCELVEMPRHHDRAFCCGAGGGRIWMEEGEIKERPSEARIREAVALNDVSALVVACPKDVTMYRDAVKTTGKEKQLVVQDLIELVYEALI